MIQAHGENKIDALEPLMTRSSNLMLAANSHRAKNEIFESAVAWVEAGRVLAELGSRFLHTDRVYEGAQELLHAAACFLESGDHRPAQEQLDRFESLPQLAALLREDEYLRSEHARIVKWCRRVGKELENALSEMREQMQQDPRGAHRLKPTWIDRTFREMPGIPELHFYVARKYTREADSKGTRGARERAIEHYRCCARLQLDGLCVWPLLVEQLLKARKWRDAVEAADEGVKRFPRSANAYASAGWSRLLYVTEGGGAKSLLSDAIRHAEKAIKLADTEEQVITETLSKATCLYLLEQEEAADGLLRKTMRKHPTAASDACLMMLQAPRSRRKAVFRKHVRPVVNRVWLNAARAESVFAGAA